MKGFPKVIKTRSDLVNTHKLVKRGSLEKEDWLAAVEKLENQNWIICPVIELSEDRKTQRELFSISRNPGNTQWKPIWKALWLFQRSLRQTTWI